MDDCLHVGDAICSCATSMLDGRCVEVAAFGCGFAGQGLVHFRNDGYHWDEREVVFKAALKLSVST
jgi:hypothetical protein